MWLHQTGGHGTSSKTDCLQCQETKSETRRKTLADERKSRWPWWWMERTFVQLQIVYFFSLSKVNVCMCVWLSKADFIQIMCSKYTYTHKIRPGDIIAFWYAVDACFYGYFQRILLIVVLVNSWDAFNEISLAPKKSSLLLPCHHNHHDGPCVSRPTDRHISRRVTSQWAWSFLWDVFHNTNLNIGRYEYETFAFQTNIPNGHLRFVSRNKCGKGSTKHIFYSGAHYLELNGRTKWNDNKRDLSLWTYDLCDNLKRRRIQFFINWHTQQTRSCGCTE